MRQTSKVHWDFKKLLKISIFTFFIPVITGVLFAFFAPSVVEHLKKQSCEESGGVYDQVWDKCNQ